MSLKQIFTRHIGLPLVDVMRKTKALDIFCELRESEFWGIDQLENLQFEKLKMILVHCKRSVAYYRKLFQDYNFDPQKMTSFSDIHCLPILYKNIIRDNFEQFKADSFSKYSPRTKETGGSTGEPLKLFHDAISHGALWANLYRGFGYGDYKLGEKYITLAYGSMIPKRLKFGMSLYFWLQNTNTYPSYQLDLDSLNEIKLLFKKKEPKYIYGYSSAILQFAKYLDQRKDTISSLKAIFTTADMLYLGQRRFIERVLKAPVYDNYGCPEAGLMANECNQHDGYHYNMETCFIETVDKDESGAGRIIATNLTNYSFPTLRYDTGDIGILESEGKCPCGRSSSKIISLLGRQRDIITLPNGRVVHGAFFNHLPVFYNNKDIMRYQIIQTDKNKIEIHLQMAKNKKIEEAEYIRDLLKNTLDRQVEVSIIEGAFRESNISKKHRTVISDVDNIWTLKI